MLQYRHELKHRIDLSDLYAIRHRLSVIATPDSHAVGGRYFIRSLYFDDGEDTALREKLDGINIREKFRIRYYNLDPSVIHLEKKSKRNSLGTKQSANLTAEQALNIAHGTVQWMSDDPQPLIQELYCKMQNGCLRPRTIVDYIREPFVYAPGNVRVTLDYHIRTAMRCIDFLDPNCITIPVPDDPIIMEVKWDNFLPTIIQDAIQLQSRHAAAFSKYAACRSYD